MAKLPAIHPTLKKVLTYTIFLGVGAFFIYLAFNNTDLTKVAKDISNADYRWIAASIAAGLISCLSRAIRWQIMAAPLGHATKLSSTFYSIMVGYMVNFAIPRGGELARATLTSQTEKIPLPKVIGTIVTERIVDLICMAIVLLLAVIIQLDTLTAFMDILPKNEEKGGLSLMQIVGIVFVAGLVVFLVFRKRIQKTALYKKGLDMVKSFGEGMKTLFTIKKPLLFVFHSVVIWVMYYLMVYFCFFAIPQTSHLGIGAGLTVLVLSTVAILIPAPGGTGSFHYIIKYGLVLYGLSLTDGLTYATIAHGSQMIMFIASGAISYFLLLYQQRKQLAGETATKNTTQNTK